MPDTHQPFGQYMHQEPTDKFSTLKIHGAGPVVPIVFVPEVHLVIFDTDNSLITDCNPVRVAGQIIHDALAALQTMFTVNHPVFLDQLQRS